MEKLTEKEWFERSKWLIEEYNRVKPAEENLLFNEGNLHHAKSVIRVVYLSVENNKLKHINEVLQKTIDKLRNSEFAGKTLADAIKSVYEPLYEAKIKEYNELHIKLKANEQKNKKLKDENKECKLINSKNEQRIKELEHRVESMLKENLQLQNKINNVENIVAESICNEIKQKAKGKELCDQYFDKFDLLDILDQLLERVKKYSKKTILN